MSNNEFTSNDSQSLACILAVHSLTQVSQRELQYYKKVKSKFLVVSIHV